MPVDQFVDVAGTIADGEAPDWTSIKTAVSSADDRGVADELELVARIAAAHRQLHQLLPAPSEAASGAFERCRWGHLELLEIVGRGSYGTVYRAWDTHLERLVALKLFHRAANPDAVMHEGKMLARIRHENVVTVYGADIIGGVAGMWMEFVHGRTLDQIVKEHGALSVRDAATIGVDVAGALAAIHGAQLLHCDVKAQNVVRESTGRVVLMDMGAGQVMADAAGYRRASDVTGTPRYMAPELFTVGAAASRASDLYGLGVLLYYLVSMRFPVDGNSIAELRQAHAEGRSEPLERVNPSVPATYGAMVSRALDRNPERRPSSSEEMQGALRQIAAPPGRPLSMWQTWVAPLVIGLTSLLLVWRPGPFAPATRVRSIAVLPIRNLTGDPSKAFFADGLTDVLISNLARVRALRVPSFEAVAPFRGKTDQAADVANKLGVQLLLAGSITQADSRFRMTVQLIDPKTGTVQWGEELTRDASGVLSAQAEVARLVATRLALTLGPDEQRALRAAAIDPRAQDAFLRGLTLRRSSPTVREDAARLFREATEIEPTFAPAWAELALVEVPLAVATANDDRQERTTLARQMAERAIRLDPTVVAGYTALGTVQFYQDWNFTAAEQTFRSALAIDPSDGMIRQRFSMLLAARGRLDEAIAMAQECTRLEPSIPLRYTSLGGIYYYARDYARATAEARHALALSPGFPTAYFELGLIAAAQHRYDEAIGNVRLAFTATHYIGWQIDLARMYAAAGRTDEKLRIMAELSDREKAGEAYGVDNLGYIAAAEGRVDDAFLFLEQAVESHSSNVLWLMVDPRVDVLHSDPRFEQLLKKSGLRQ